MILILLADGFEEIEALTPLDVLRRAGLDVKTVGISGKFVEGSHGIRVECDLSESEALNITPELLILPGGMPGATNLDASTTTDRLIKTTLNSGGRLAAICAAPLVLGRRGLLKGRRAVCYPGFEGELACATVCDAPVVTDGCITTAKGMGAALDFALELVELLVSTEQKEKIAKAIMKP
ncbi:MAG: DJ-1/PfpI family protein [Clostridia bacterium]|nr:DJ-1/PfpI family protein [Clostridia bacterium]